MKKIKELRERINLSIACEILEFAKKWSYVTKQPISHLVEDMFREKKDYISDLTPEQYLYDPDLSHHQPSGDDAMQIFDDWLEDKAEVEYCQKNPESKRAKMRVALVKQREAQFTKEERKRKELQEAFIARWREVFPSEYQ